MHKIELVENGKEKFAENILRRLPDWFGIETSILNYVSDISKMPTYFAIDQTGDKVGFATIHFHNASTAEIHVMGVLSQFHGQGVGKQLVDALARAAKNKGCTYLMVKTLGESHPDKNYTRTRQFYLSTGFLPLEESTKIWDGMPCLIMVKSLT